MYTEYPSIHHSAQAQVIENITTISPNIARPIFPLTLVVKAVNLGDLSGLVITSDQGDSVGIPDFEEKKEYESLNGVEASINKVTWETQSR